MGGLSVAMLPRTGDRPGQRVLVLAESAAQAWDSFALIALTSAGVCDRTLRPNLGRGAVPCPADFSTSILPGFLLLDWPVKCPLYARAIDIFWGCASKRSKLLPAVFPVPEPVASEAGCPNWLSLTRSPS